MLHQTIPPYEGSQPFLYACYCVQDEELALPILARMYNEGFRLFSALGCASSSDFRSIQRLNASASIMLFMSRNMLDCIRRSEPEVIAAVKSSCLRIIVQLDDSEPSSDIYAMSVPEKIAYSTGNDAPFWLYIYSNDALEKCRGPWPEKKLQTTESQYDDVPDEQLSEEYRRLESIMMGDTLKNTAPVREERFRNNDGYIVPEPDQRVYIPLPPPMSSELKEVVGMIDEQAMRAEAVGAAAPAQSWPEPQWDTRWEDSAREPAPEPAPVYAPVPEPASAPVPAPVPKADIVIEPSPEAAPAPAPMPASVPAAMPEVVPAAAEPVPAPVPAPMPAPVPEVVPVPVPTPAPVPVPEVAPMPAPVPETAPVPAPTTVPAPETAPASDEPQQGYAVSAPEWSENRPKRKHRFVKTTAPVPVVVRMPGEQRGGMHGGRRLKAAVRTVRPVQDAPVRTMRLNTAPVSELLEESRLNDKLYLKRYVRRLAKEAVREDFTMLRRAAEPVQIPAAESEPKERKSARRFRRKPAAALVYEPAEQTLPEEADLPPVGDTAIDTEELSAPAPAEDTAQASARKNRHPHRSGRFARLLAAVRRSGAADAEPEDLPQDIQPASDSSTILEAAVSKFVQKDDETVTVIPKRVK